eukprot:TRINITY_DN2096_c7_g1_i1.p1 TRINITY_DN2096_c7_g1~~TRINITY_DN2096_c7_g1_i1.p1  ORF type:complete len:262 (+),score=58.74 TRINITY_DN2096_c7_g1_i1:49-786(+)
MPLWKDCLKQHGIEGDLFKAAEMAAEILPEEGNSHGICHAVAVAVHGKKAVEAEENMGEGRKEEVIMACILHDTDDAKLFEKNTRNAESILTKLGWDKDRADTVMMLISLVSCRDNKNKVSTEHLPWMYLPRDADRIEALGEKGLKRCYLHQKETSTPLFTSTTPRASTREELYTIATPERFAAYVGTSASMVDHCYDKLLHINKPSTENPYLNGVFEERGKVLENFCLDFGRNGLVDEEYLESL